MKLTVITNSNGQVIGTVRGNPNDHGSDGFQAGLILEKGQKQQDIDVPDDYVKLSADELHHKVADRIKTHNPN